MIELPPLTLASAATFTIAGAVTCLTYRRANRSAARADADRSTTRLGVLTGRLDWCFRATTAVIAFGSLVTPRLPLLRVHDSGIITMAGLVIVLLAQALLVIAMRTLSDQYRPCFRATAPTRLIETGPYRWVRHPIYTANVMTLFGVALATGSVLLLLLSIALLVVYITGLAAEEAQIDRALPEYAAYRARTGAIFPRLR